MLVGAAGSREDGGLLVIQQRVPGGRRWAAGAGQWALGSERAGLGRRSRAAAPLCAVRQTEQLPWPTRWITGGAARSASRGRRPRSDGLGP